MKSKDSKADKKMDLIENKHTHTHTHKIQRGTVLTLAKALSEEAGLQHLLRHQQGESHLDLLRLMALFN